MLPLASSVCSFQPVIFETPFEFVVSVALYNPTSLRLFLFSAFKKSFISIVLFAVGKLLLYNKPVG
jgi:hypothetical protein